MTAGSAKGPCGSPKRRSAYRIPACPSICAMAVGAARHGLSESEACYARLKQLRAVAGERVPSLRASGTSDIAPGAITDMRDTSAAVTRIQWKPHLAESVGHRPPHRSMRQSARSLRF